MKDQSKRERRAAALLVLGALALVILGAQGGARGTAREAATPIAENGPRSTLARPATIPSSGPWKRA